jgi:hypothetical protein
LIAADIDGDGAVNRDDAQAILAQAYGVETTAPGAPMWRFVEASRDLSATTSSNIPTLEAISAYADLETNVRLVGILVGDVNGSWGAL